MGRFTTAEKNKRRMALVQEAFKARYVRRFGDCVLLVYEAPAAGYWVVIAGAEAWAADGSEEEFVFWGPLGRHPITFPVPEEWPR